MVCPSCVGKIAGIDATHRAQSKHIKARSIVLSQFIHGKCYQHSEPQTTHVMEKANNRTILYDFSAYIPLDMVLEEPVLMNFDSKV